MNCRLIKVFLVTGVLLPFLLLHSSCNFFNDEENKKDIIVRAFDKYLYRSDLKGLLPAGTTPQDSIAILQNFIDNWIRQQVILNKAENNLSDDQKNVEKQLADYRNSLITFAYEKELVDQKLDTVVSLQEIEGYYKNNPDNFELKDNIIKVLYLKVEKNAPKIEKVRQWYKSNNPKDLALLEEYCHQYAINFFLDENTWLLFDDLLKEIPIKTYDKEQYLKNNRFIEIADSSTVYFVNIKGFKVKDGLSPLSFEKENIQNIILNQRKLKLIQEMEKKTYLEALNNKDFEIY